VKGREGRELTDDRLREVHELVQTHPQWSRYRLSRELCALWDWRTATGQWKDMAARTLLAGVLGPGRRFINDAQLAAYAGVAPLEASSAGLVRPDRQAGRLPGLSR